MNKEIKLPNNVQNLAGCFLKCSKLEKAPEIPKNVRNMKNMFQDAISLKYAPKIIPEGVENMQSTFQGCINLETFPNIIPYSVKNLVCTFYNCTKMEGELIINADDNSQIDACFLFASTKSTDYLYVTGTCSKLDDIIATKSVDSKIMKK